ncbi:hypothetical protein ZWY2020_059622 [Hordeum vulgare]|nr:hypothetical protein ZWY2020_059622 [Hordeum vulgare]
MYVSRQVRHEHTFETGHIDTSYPPPSPAPQPPSRPRLTPFRILVRVFIGFCTFIGVLSLLIWLIYRPRTIQIAVDSATLTSFHVNSTTSPPVLSFNLTAGLSISNPNKRVSVYYDRLQVEGFYQEERFGRAPLPLSFQGVRRTDAMRAVLQGNSVGYFDNATGSGTDVFPVDLWLDGTVRYKFGELTTTSASTLSVKCPLVLQLMEASSRVECIVISF